MKKRIFALMLALCLLASACALAESMALFVGKASWIPEHWMRLEFVNANNGVTASVYLPTDPTVAGDKYTCKEAKYSEATGGVDYSGKYYRADMNAQTYYVSGLYLTDNERDIEYYLKGGAIQDESRYIYQPLTTDRGFTIMRRIDKTYGYVTYNVVGDPDENGMRLIMTAEIGPGNSENVYKDWFIEIANAFETTLEFTMPVPETSELPGYMEKLFVGKQLLTANGAIDANLFGQYSVVFHANNTADFVLGGYRTEGIAWYLDGDVIAIDYNGLVIPFLFDGENLDMYMISAGALRMNAAEAAPAADVPAPVIDSPAPVIDNPAPVIDAPAPQAGDGFIGVVYAADKLIANDGVETDAASIGVYKVQFNADNTATLTLYGTPVYGLAWTQTDNTIAVEYFGNTLNFVYDGTAMNMNFFGGGTMHMIAE